MKASIGYDATTNTMTVTMADVDWQAARTGSFYLGEVQVQEILNVVGQELTTDLLRQHEVTDERWEYAGQTYYRKEASVGHYQTLHGELAVARHLYQTSAGGVTVCPLEIKAGFQFGSATPRLAEVVAFKVASATPREVAQDLKKSTRVNLSASYLSEVAQQVGARALARKTPRVMAVPERPVCVVATGVDGTTLPLVEENYKEAMCGTLAVYDLHGERLGTEYHATMPQAGKADFEAEMAQRTQAVLKQFQPAVHVCLGDGAKWNWEFFRRYFPLAWCILDFYHATLHLHAAAELIFGAGAAAENYYEKWRERLLEKVGAARGLLHSLRHYLRVTKFTARARKALRQELNYFAQHVEHMEYAKYRLLNLPIGSGVTEAACKEVIKARFCRSGMRWTRAGGAPLLQLRTLRLSLQWDDFWTDVMAVTH
jgi:hypothetical protein